MPTIIDRFQTIDKSGRLPPTRYGATGSHEP